MKINELLEAKEEATCGCGPACGHCGGKHTMKEVGTKCSCCDNEIKAVTAEGTYGKKKKKKKYNETTSAGSVAAVAGGIGTMQKRNMYNTDGTMKNALDTGDLLGGATPSSKKKKSSKKA